MFPGPHEDATQVNQADAIQSQSLDGSPADGCDADNQSAVVAPDEMICPAVLTWVEEQNGIFADGIACHRFREFVIVATLAG